MKIIKKRAITTTRQTEILKGHIDNLISQCKTQGKCVDLQELTNTMLVGANAEYTQTMILWCDLEMKECERRLNENLEEYMVEYFEAKKFDYALLQAACYKHYINCDESEKS